MLETGSIGFATAFAAGVISFLSPCVLPLVPGYLSYVAGTSLEELRDRQSARLQSLGYAVCFVLGFSVVFVSFGASATALGSLLLSWRYELGVAPGSWCCCSGCTWRGCCRSRSWSAKRGSRPTSKAGAWSAPFCSASPSPSAGRPASGPCWA